MLRSSELDQIKLIVHPELLMNGSVFENFVCREQWISYYLLHTWMNEVSNMKRSDGAEKEKEIHNFSTN